MADRTVRVQLAADIKDFLGPLGAAAAATKSFAAQSAASMAAASVGVAKGANSVISQPGKTAKAVAGASKTAAAGAASAAASYARIGEEQAEHLNRLSRNLRNVGLVGVGAAVAAVKVASDFDAQMSKVAMTGQDARNNLVGLRDAAREVTSGKNNIGYSATEAAEGLEYLAKAGVSAQDSIEGGLAGSLQLAAAGGQSVGDAAETAATAMAQFQLSGKDVPHIADLLSAGAGKAQGSVEQLGYALKYVGPVAQGMGISIEETVGTLAEFANAGILGEHAGTSMRGVLLALTSPSKVASEQMSKLGIEMYGADGKFVGLAGAAQQLREKMVNLSEADRNAALGRIFGNAQITAARVLYEKGAAGVEEWTGKVNEAGYAEEAARTRLDNLRGDMTKLKAALTNTLIGAGEGAQSPLRGVTQSATGVVSALGKIPPGAADVGVKLAAVGGFALLGMAGVLKLTTSLGQGREAMSRLRTEAPRTAKALGAAGKGIGVVGAAFAVATVGTALLTNKTKPLIASVEAAKAAITGLADSSTMAGENGNKLRGSLDGIFQGQGGKALLGKEGFRIDVQGGGSVGLYRREVTNLGTALQRTLDPTKYERFSGWMENTFGSLVGQDPADTDAGKLAASFDTLDKALASSDPKQAAKGFNEFAAQLKATGHEAKDALPILDDYYGSLQAQANDLHVAVTDDQYVEWMGGKVPAAIEEARKKTLDGAQGFAAQQAAIEAVRGSLESLASPQKRTADESANLAKGLFTEGNAAQNAAGAHLGYEEAIDASRKVLEKNGDQLTKNGKALNDHTAKGRENKTALLNLATAGKGYITALAEQGASQEKLVGATKNVRKEFVKQAQDAGLSEKAAKKLADSYGLVPSEVSTTVDLFGQAAAQAQVAQFLADLGQLPEEQQAEILAVYQDKGAKAALAEFEKLNGTKAKPKVEADSDAKTVAKGAKNAIKDAGKAFGKPKIKTDSDAKKKGKEAKDAVKGAGKTKGSPEIKVKSDAKKKSGEAKDAVKGAGKTKGTPEIKVKSNAKEKAGEAKGAVKDAGKGASVVIKVSQKGAGTVVAKVQGIKGKSVTVKVDQNGVGAVKNAIDSIHGKTVTVTVHTKKTGGNAAGGHITGPGTATSDDIPTWLSNGEYVLRAAAVRAIGVARLDQFNAMGGPQLAMASGGFVGARGYATGGEVTGGAGLGGISTSDLLSVAALVKLLTAVAHPLENIATLTAAVAYQQKQVAAAHATTIGLLNSPAVRKYNSAVKARDEAQIKDAKRLSDADAKVDKARAAYAENATKANKKALKKAEAEYKKTQSSVDKDLKAKDKAAQKAEDKGGAAVQAYNDALDKEKDATDALATANEALASSQKDVADAARATSDTFREMYASQSTDAADWIDLMQEGASDIVAFTAQVAALRKAGLDETVLQQIVGMGATAGSAIAEQLLEGGSTLVAGLNSAQAGIQSAADQLGLVANTGATGARGGASPNTLKPTDLPTGFTPASGGYAAGIDYPTASAPLVKVEQARLAAVPSVSVQVPQVDQAAIATAVYKGLQGLTLTGTVDGTALKVSIDKAIGGLVTGFGKANAA